MTLKFDLDYESFRPFFIAAYNIYSLTHLLHVTSYVTSGDNDLLIWAMSYAGHLQYYQKVSLTHSLVLDKTYDLEDQIVHKLHILDQLIPASAR